MAKRISKTKSKPSAPKAREPELAIVYEAVQIAQFYSGDRPSEQPDTINYSTEVTYQIDAVDQSVSVLVHIEGIADYGDRSIPESVASSNGILFGISVRSVFRIEGMKYLTRLDEGTIDFPGWVLASTVSGAVGTARGVLLQKLAGTTFAKLIPPLISLNTLLPDEIATGIANHGI